MMNRTSMKSYGRQQGVGIVEVLIALVVVSFGVLGMAGLQLTGMKHSTSGFNRVKASLYAENMATRMRGNQEGVTDFHYDGMDGTGVNCNNAPASICQDNASADAVECTALEIATFDFYSLYCGTIGTGGAVSNGLSAELLNGDMAIACDDAPCLANSNYTLTVSWDELQDAGGVEGDVAQKRVQIRFNP